MEVADPAVWVRMAELLERWVPRPVVALTLVLLFWLVAGVLRHGLKTLLLLVFRDRTAISLATRLIYYTTIGFGLVTAAQVLKIPLRGLFTGLGLTSLGLAFALKDLISNFVSGLLLLSMRPFQIGDQIEVGKVEGTVERIQFRATHIRCYDGRNALIPSTNVLTSVIINNTAQPHRRTEILVRIDYDNDLDRALNVIAETMSKVDGVRTDPLPAIDVDELGDTDILLSVKFWTGSRNKTLREARTRVRCQLFSALRAAGIRLPAPEYRLVAQANREH